MLAIKASAAVMELVCILSLASSTDLITPLQLRAVTGLSSHLFLVSFPMPTRIYPVITHPKLAPIQILQGALYQPRDRLDLRDRILITEPPSSPPRLVFPRPRLTTENMRKMMFQSLSITRRNVLETSEETPSRPRTSLHRFFP
jgi:hypothetical protein